MDVIGKDFPGLARNAVDGLAGLDTARNWTRIGGCAGFVEKDNEKNSGNDPTADPKGVFFPIGRGVRNFESFALGG